VLESFKNGSDYLGFIVLSIKYHVLNGSMNKFNILDDSAVWYDFVTLLLIEVYDFVLTFSGL